MGRYRLAPRVQPAILPLLPSIHLLRATDHFIMIVMSCFLSSLFHFILKFSTSPHPFSKLQCFALSCSSSSVENHFKVHHFFNRLNSPPPVPPPPLSSSPPLPSAFSAIFNSVNKHFSNSTIDQFIPQKGK